MLQIEYQCKDLVFHFNKGHLTDPTIPMWVIKSHGVTFYVNHVSAEIPWTTKETPDNENTKGSLKFKKCKLVIDQDNNATISKLGLLDRNLPHPKVVHARIIAGGSSEFHLALQRDEFKYSPIKRILGGCGSSFIVCDLLDKDEVLIAAMKYAGKFRIMSPNEAYYQDYDKQGSYIEERYYDEEDDD